MSNCKLSSCKKRASLQPHCRTHSTHPVARALSHAHCRTRPIVPSRRLSRSAAVRRRPPAAQFRKSRNSMKSHPKEPYQYPFKQRGARKLGKFGTGLGAEIVASNENGRRRTQGRTPGHDSERTCMQPDAATAQNGCEAAPSDCRERTRSSADAFRVAAASLNRLLEQPRRPLP